MIGAIRSASYLSTRAVRKFSPERLFRAFSKFLGNPLVVIGVKNKAVHSVNRRTGKKSHGDNPKDR
jgi:hypothetical protein